MMIQAALGAYEQASLPVAADEVRPRSCSCWPPAPAAAAATNFVAWGTEVAGHRGEVATEGIKRTLLTVVTLRALASNRISGDFMRRLVSCYVHPFSHRRELFALIHRVHKFRSSMLDRSPVLLPPDVKDELASCAVH